MSTEPKSVPDILVVDDTPANLRLITEMLRERGFKPRPVLSGKLALQAARSSPPDLVLLDINMPELDGYSVCEQLKADARMREVPVIFLSARDEAIDKVRAFRAGGVDYVSKPFHFEEVEARVNVHLKLKSLREESEARARQLESALGALRAREAQLRAELTVAAEYVFSLLPSRLEQGPIRTDWRFIPSAELGGDSFGYHWLDSDHFAFYLLDVSGHGVGSALHSVSILNTLRNGSLPGLDFRDPGGVLTALNDAYSMRRHASFYFTIGYGVIDLSRGELRYAGGGHPPAIVCTPGREAVRVPSGGPPVGCFAGTRYPTCTHPLQGPSGLYLFSDGVFDVRKSDGSRSSFEGFVSFLAHSSGGGPGIERPSLDEVHNRVAAVSGRHGLTDDFSILKLVLV
ncbi:MAG: SpoIIE family protein phosphatase [Verrucomicrobia bacterium]|nr:SpoIIE family protein phosphatase [Verrucomicrobiota bacterium]